jgi:hypothetical protein
MQYILILYGVSSGDCKLTLGHPGSAQGTCHPENVGRGDTIERYRGHQLGRPGACLKHTSMLHVVRYEDGTIQSISRDPVPGGEPLEEHNPEIQSFLGRKGLEPAFDSADADFVRVIEDLIDTLIAKNVIRHTDLPAAAQKKLLLRKGLRNRVKGALNLLGGDERLL